MLRSGALQIIILEPLLLHGGEKERKKHQREEGEGLQDCVREGC